MLVYGQGAVPGVEGGRRPNSEEPSASCVSLGEESGELPVTHTALLLPTPNPFNPQTELHFQLKDACDVDLSIHNIKGERVVRLASGVHSAGRHAVVWRGIDQSGRRLASGT